MLKRMCKPFLYIAFLFVVSLVASGANAQRDVSVPQSCTPQVNQKLGDLLSAGQSHAVDNVMVCGITVSSSRTQRGGRHGSHEVLPLRVQFPDGSTHLVEVVTNDDLDGMVTAPVNAQVFAYGQAFFPSRGRFVAGIHDVHCATHRGADNGWVVVNGQKYPSSCTASR
ncbi:hypothetical protein [Pseudacidobacterium ailaaui]|jgi:hypothetical protein|uniref:hypothetical protein n=1 Tax=Pseudacidobacterium ailaaui TaxID=1382359 RepID=UPI00047DCA43|nr:hypothetical protein [Pseudacidobacterium ailaaui]MBX6358919.1 hypothetical protein [Pseudacidobacterium ailaaui]MDI3255048.1 hypothetical protein [Bacillota bacterium]